MYGKKHNFVKRLYLMRLERTGPKTLKNKINLNYMCIKIHFPSPKNHSASVIVAKL
jgi:hypothetical protein